MESKYILYYTIWIYTCRYICRYVCTYVCMYVHFLCIYICTCVSMYLSTHKVHDIKNRWTWPKLKDTLYLSITRNSQNTIITLQWTALLGHKPVLILVDQCLTPLFKYPAQINSDTQLEPDYLQKFSVLLSKLNFAPQLTVATNQISRTSISTPAFYSQSVKILEYQKPNPSHTLTYCIIIFDFLQCNNVKKDLVFFVTA